MSTENNTARGPLADIRVIELGGAAPGSHAALLLADLGADVVRVQRPGSLTDSMERPQWRGRSIVEANLKDPVELEKVLGLIGKADVLIEGFRPGATERMGLGPDVALERNPRLVYGRMTGWGQYGPLADRAGHDINFISLTGVLNAVGRKGERPVPPLNLIGDFGGGSMFLVFGILAALLERQRSGKGQVIDAAMIDGVLALSQMVWSMKGMGLWSDERGTNFLDTGMAFYDTYETADGGHMAVGSVEPPFYAELLRVLDIDPTGLPNQLDPAGQDQLRKLFTEKFKTKTRDEWWALFEQADACTTPVLTFTEAEKNPHIQARTSLIDIDGVVQHAPAPRFSRTPPGVPRPTPNQSTPIDQVWSS